MVIPILVGIGILVVIMVLVIWYIRRIRGSYMYLLEAKVVTSDAQDYYVTFRELHPETKPVEYVWLCLLLASKLLYIMGNDPQYAVAKRLFHDLIRKLGNTNLSGIEDVVKITGNQIRVLDVSEAPPGKTIVAKLAYVNLFQRMLWTSLPVTWFASQFLHTFISVCDAALPKLDTMHRDRLQGSLARMAELYAEGRDPASLAALLEVSHFAFNEAKVIR